MRDPVAGGQKRILGLDVGLRRIGLALSDPLGITAQGIETLVRGNLKRDLARLSRLAEENDVGLFVVGLPLHMSGEDSRQGVGQGVRGPPRATQQGSRTSMG